MHLKVMALAKRQKDTDVKIWGLKITSKNQELKKLDSKAK